MYIFKWIHVYIYIERERERESPDSMELKVSAFETRTREKDAGKRAGDRVERGWKKRQLGWTEGYQEKDGAAVKDLDKVYARLAPQQVTIQSNEAAHVISSVIN